MLRCFLPNVQPKNCSLAGLWYEESPKTRVSPYKTRQSLIRDQTANRKPPHVLWNQCRGILAKSTKKIQGLTSNMCSKQSFMHFTYSMWNEIVDLGLDGLCLGKGRSCTRKQDFCLWSSEGGMNAKRRVTRNCSIKQPSSSLPLITIEAKYAHYLSLTFPNISPIWW